MNADITVVVPYYNEQETIEYTLEQVGAQSLPAKQAVFVNSSSTDDTSDIINLWIRKNQHRFSTQFKNLFENTHNPGSSKNVGIRHAVTDWVAFMDCGQRFERNWLEKQYEFALENKVDVTSGVVYCIGENWVDRCAVAQTYGYKRNRACLPTTLVNRDVFNKTGLFSEGRRAGYDAAWLMKLEKVGVKRGINDEVRIQYIGTNFAVTLGNLYSKSALYTKQAIGLEGYPIPYSHFIIPLLALSACIISTTAILVVTIGYLFARAFFFPVMKSKNIFLYREYPLEAALGLVIVGFVMDCGKIKGSLFGLWAHLFKPTIIDR